MQWQFWIIQTLNSVAFGGLLFLLSSGFSLIFGLMRIPNLMHGSFFMLGAFFGLAIANATGSFWLALALAPVPVIVLGVAMDEEGWAAVKPFVSSHKVNYRMVIGDDMTAQKFGGVESLPTSFLIDKEGRIAAVHVGLVSKKDYANDIAQLLGNTPDGLGARDRDSKCDSVERHSGHRLTDRIPNRLDDDCIVAKVDDR